MYSSPLTMPGMHPGGQSLGGMVFHWVDILVTPQAEQHHVKDTNEYDIMARFMVDVVFRQYLQEYVRAILKGEKSIDMLEIELSSMREMFAVNWMNLKTNGRAFSMNAHGHSLKSCYENLNNPNYRHTGHNAAHHKCLWEYYLNQMIH